MAAHLHCVHFQKLLASCCLITLMLSSLAIFSRYKELVDKNERTKAEIRRRDEARKARADKQLEESALKASFIVAQKKKALEYCTAKGSFGTSGGLATATNRSMTARRTHPLKRPAS